MRNRTIRRTQPGYRTPRVNLGSETCGSCHGEPARHGRFQQWQLSNHADYDLARSRGASSGNCSRCHSGNGFIAWSKLDFDPDQQVSVTWDQDTVVPQICAACHNPHDTGTTSGSDGTNARVRVNVRYGWYLWRTGVRYLRVACRLHGEQCRQGCDLHDLPQLASRIPAQRQHLGPGGGERRHD